MLVPGNIDLSKRPIVHNRDGSYSTVRSITVTDGKGRAVLIPTVVGDKVVSNNQAVRHYQKTGQHLGIFDSEADADAYAQTLHEAQAAQYGPRADLPTGPPHPALQAVGFNGSIHDFNQRLHAVAQAHTAASGTRPTPGLALDLVRSPIPVEHFGPLLDNTPRMMVQARAQKALNAHPLEKYQGESFVSGIQEAVKAGTLPAYMAEHGDDITALAKQDKSFAAKLYPVLSSGIRGAYESGQLESSAPPLAGVARVLSLGAGQVANSLVHAPGALYKIGATIAKGDVGVVTGNNAKIDEANAEFGTAVKGSVAATKQDVLHPRERPGFLFLDVLGLAAPVTRLAAGGRALAAGEGLTAAELAVTKKAGGTVSIGREGAKEDALLSANPAVAAWQRARLATRQAKLDASVAGEEVPAGLRSVLLPAFANDWLDRNFSFERKLGREADARMRVQHIVDTSVANELDRVARGTVVESRVLRRLPAPLRRGLSRGEQKAIQTLSFGVTPDEQIAFHQRMIDAGIGDATAHTRQIADLQLAKKVLANPSPSARFTNAVALTQRVVDQTQARKIDALGLSPVSAAQRVGKPAAAMEATSGAQTYAATGRVEPFYTKLETGKKRPPTSRGGYFASRPSRFGEGPPQLPPELTNEFTGKSIINGKYSIDATGLTTQAMARTMRAATVLSEHEKHWEAGTDLPRSAYDMPVRDKRAISGKLRDALNALEDNVITPQEAEHLPADMRAVLNELYITPDDFAREHGDLSAITKPIPGVRFFDRRSIGSASNLGAPAGARGAMKALEIVNEPFRDLTLFLRPAYALNAVGNAVMLAFDEGFAAVPNVAWALRAKDALGGEAYRIANELVGTGRSKSYASGMSLKPGRALAAGWTVLTDRVFRVAALRHYARELGYTTDSELRDLLLSGGKDLAEASRRANKSLVEFDNLAPIEADYLRHIIFVYPWVSRSTVYSLRAIMEHPAKLAILANLGDQEVNSDPIFKNVPEWFKRTGYFPIGWTADGKPKVVNATSINTFATLSDLLSVGQAGISGSRYDSLENLLGPGATFGVHAVTGRDEFGNKYPGGQWGAAARALVEQLPQALALARSTKANPPLKPINVEQRGSVEARFNSALKRVVFSPGWLNGFGSLIAGGFSPRTEDPLAASARFWRDKTPDERHGLEHELLNRALNIQGQLLKQPVPANVRDGVKVASDLTYAFSRFASANGRTPTLRERADLTLDYMTRRGSLDLRKAFAFKKELAATVDPVDIQAIVNKVVADHGNGKAVRQWDSDVRLVASFKAPVFAEKVAALHAQGIIPSATRATQAQLYAYGRKYLAFSRQAKKLAEKVKAGNATSADLRAFQDANDHPVDGLPSFVRTAWGYNTPDQQRQALIQAAGSAWTSLSGFEKELLGHKVTAKVGEAWAAFQRTLNDWHKAEPTGRFGNYEQTYLAKKLDKYYGLGGAFVGDYRFSRQPAFVRLATVKQIKTSSNAADWKLLLDAAKRTYASHVSNPDGYPLSYLRGWWDKQIDSDTYQSWIAARPKFKAELDAYGGDTFVKGLLSR